MRGDLQTECQCCQTEKKINKYTGTHESRTKQSNASIETKDWLSNGLN